MQPSYQLSLQSDNQTFNLDTILSDIPNPTIKIKDKFISGFYIGNGGGSGAEYQWTNNQWTVKKHFQVTNNGFDTLPIPWIIKYNLNNKTDTIFHRFQMIPPKEVLETIVR